LYCGTSSVIVSTLNVTFTGPDCRAVYSSEPTAWLVIATGMPMNGGAPIWIGSVRSR
jgi:hypothetical protein